MKKIIRRNINDLTCGIILKANPDMIEKLINMLKDDRNYFLVFHKTSMGFLKIYEVG